MERESHRTGEFLHEGMHEPSQIAGYLRAIAEGLESGTLSLASGGEELLLRPGGPCTFELSAGHDHRRVHVALKLAWRDRGQGGESDDLSISMG